jgi:hypothetical protein
VILGGAHGNRYMPGMEVLIGMFMNTIAYKYPMDLSMNVYKFIELVRSLYLEMMKRSIIPYDEIINRLRCERIEGTNPLVQILTLASLK